MAGALRGELNVVPRAGGEERLDQPNSSPGRVLSATQTAELRPWYGADAPHDVSCNQIVTLRYADIESCTAT